MTHALPGWPPLPPPPRAGASAPAVQPRACIALQVSSVTSRERLSRPHARLVGPERADLGAAAHPPLPAARGSCVARTPVPWPGRGRLRVAARTLR